MIFSSIQIASRDGEAYEDRILRAERFLEQIYKSEPRPSQILFPEIWATGFFSFDRYRKEAQTLQGDFYDMMSSWAARIGCYIHTGSFVEKDGDEYYNTSLMFDPTGRLIGRYRKMHLFGYQSKEADILTRGNEVVVLSTEYGRVGLATCYDLRFPELFRDMLDKGAEYFLVTSAWPLVRLSDWELFNRVRALENQCFLISCNGTGELNGTRLGGHSMIVSPRGELISAGGKEEGIISANIDPNELKDFRKNFPVLADRL